MAKSSKEMILIDEIKIMDALAQHAKDSVDEIAKQCRCSRQKVWRIIKELEKKKIIWGYVTIIDEIARNLKHFTVLVRRNTVPFKEDVQKEIISRKLDQYPMDIVKIENIYLTHGNADWILTFYAPDLVTAKKFVDATFERFNQYLQGFDLIETLVSVRKNGIKNPRMKELVQYV